jgi:hypothetical protein
MRTAALAFTAGLAALAACQAPDVGGDCSLDFTVPQPVVADYLETGRPECDNLVCIRSQLTSKNANKKEAYCSKPCVADADCSPSDTGLLCRKVVLDPAFLATLSDATKQKYLGDTGQFSSYCAAPLAQ